MFNEGCLHWMEFAILRQSFNGCDLFACHGAHWSKTRPVRHSVDEHGAGPALAFPAPVLGARQVKVIPKDPKQWPLRIRLDTGAHTVHHEIHGFILVP